jgi:hypothetical protein
MFLAAEDSTMKLRAIVPGIVVAATLVSRSTSARNDVERFSIGSALQPPEARAKLDPSVSLYFGPAPHPAVVADLGDFKTNKKTRSFGRADQEACDWAFLSAVMQLQERARSLRADAVVEIESNYKNAPFASHSLYECGVGGFVAGVALRGRFVKLASAAPPAPGRLAAAPGAPPPPAREAPDASADARPASTR